MFWEALPLDIRVYILSIRHEKREEACKKYKKCGIIIMTKLMLY